MVELQLSPRPTPEIPDVKRRSQHLPRYLRRVNRRPINASRGPVNRGRRVGETAQTCARAAHCPTFYRLPLVSIKVYSRFRRHDGIVPSAIIPPVYGQVRKPVELPLPYRAFDVDITSPLRMRFPTYPQTRGWPVRTACQCLFTRCQLADNKGFEPLITPPSRSVPSQ